MNTLANELVSIQTSKAPAPSRAERQTGGLVDREGGTRVIFDIDGTRERPRRVCFPFRLDHAFWETGCRGRSDWSLDA